MEDFQDQSGDGRPVKSVDVSAVLIAGPTASGKSQLALEIAAARNGVIINADSMQVYSDLRLLSARPSVAEEAAAPHFLYGHVDGGEPYSTGHWVRAAASVLAQAEAAGKLPVIVGGTGLYFTALTEGLSPVPAIPADIRRRYRDCSAPLSELRRDLAACDPEWAAEAETLDRQRALRALEVKAGTGRSLKYWQRTPGQPVLTGNLARFVVAPPRPALYQRIDGRFDRMVDGGALDEVQALMARGLPPHQPVMRALGVRQLADFLAGVCSREDAIADAQMQTRRYAKRQMTWLRGNMQSWNWLEQTENYRDSDKIFSFIDENCLTD